MHLPVITREYLAFYNRQLRLTTRGEATLTAKVEKKAKEGMLRLELFGRSLIF